MTKPQVYRNKLGKYNKVSDIVSGLLVNYGIMNQHTSTDAKFIGIVWIVSNYARDLI
ncbi:MAG: hypothetical protein ABJB76_01650 [Candidatus Nitrosocosmicus sp.]